MHQRYVYGRTLDCTKWWSDYENCQKYASTKDPTYLVSGWGGGDWLLVYQLVWIFASWYLVDLFYPEIGSGILNIRLFLEWQEPQAHIHNGARHDRTLNLLKPNALQIVTDLALTIARARAKRSSHWPSLLFTSITAEIHLPVCPLSALFPLKWQVTRLTFDWWIVELVFGV